MVDGADQCTRIHAPPHTMERSTALHHPSTHHPTLHHHQHRPHELLLLLHIFLMHLILNVSLFPLILKPLPTFLAFFVFLFLANALLMMLLIRDHQQNLIETGLVFVATSSSFPTS